MTVCWYSSFRDNRRQQAVRTTVCVRLLQQHQCQGWPLLLPPLPPELPALRQVHLHLLRGTRRARQSVLPEHSARGLRCGQVNNYGNQLFDAPDCLVKKQQHPDVREVIHVVCLCKYSRVQSLTSLEHFVCISDISDYNALLCVAVTARKVLTSLQCVTVQTAVPLCWRASVTRTTLRR